MTFFALSIKMIQDTGKAYSIVIRLCFRAKNGALEVAETQEISPMTTTKTTVI